MIFRDMRKLPIRCSHKVFIKLYGFLGFLLQCLDDSRLTLTNHKITGDLVFLPETPEAAYGLVVLLIAPRWEINGMVAMLPIQTHGFHLGLSNQALYLASGERYKQFLFLVDAHVGRS